jgi:hypothetical protein
MVTNLRSKRHAMLSGSFAFATVHSKRKREKTIELSPM